MGGVTGALGGGGGGNGGGGGGGNEHRWRRRPGQDTLTRAEAQAQCIAQGISLLDTQKLNDCIAGLLG